MKITIAYDKRSCVTGRNLFESFKRREKFNTVRRVRKDKKVRNTDIFIRWGNSQSWGPECKHVLNTASAVRNASSKNTMMRILEECETVQALDVFRPSQASQVNVNYYRDEDGYFYVRGANQSVRYDNQFTSSDLYISKPIEKRNEYRVHVFKGNVIAIYEKIPYEDGVKIYKNQNCKFRRLDISRANCNAIAQQMAIDAVAALGLDFGGVDVIRDQRKDFFINEVNSSPSLNSINVENWIDHIIDFVSKDEIIVEELTDDDIL